MGWACLISIWALSAKFDLKVSIDIMAIWPLMILSVGFHSRVSYFEQWRSDGTEDLVWQNRLICSPCIADISSLHKFSIFFLLWSWTLNEFELGRRTFNFFFSFVVLVTFLVLRFSQSNLATPVSQQPSETVEMSLSISCNHSKC